MSRSKSFYYLAVLLHGVLIGLLVVKVAEDPGTVEPKVKQLASGIADRIYLSQLGWVQIALAPHCLDTLCSSILSLRAARLACLLFNCFPHLEQSMKWFWTKASIHLERSWTVSSRLQTLCMLKSQACKMISSKSCSKVCFGIKIPDSDSPCHAGCLPSWTHFQIFSGTQGSDTQQRRHHSSNETYSGMFTCQFFFQNYWAQRCSVTSVVKTVNSDSLIPSWCHLHTSKPLYIALSPTNLMSPLAGLPGCCLQNVADLEDQPPGTSFRFQLEKVHTSKHLAQPCFNFYCYVNHHFGFSTKSKHAACE